jgi:hypothetical protein
MEKVRNRAGFKANRTADAMALSLWPSRGHELHGYEVKVSRADWRSELRDAAKADTWHGIVDRWWIAAPSGVVPRDELPATWGLIEATSSGKFRVAVQAPVLTQERAMISRDLLVPLLRAAGAELTCTPEQQALAAAKAEGWSAGRDAARKSGNDWQRMYESMSESAAGYRDSVGEIERVLGTSIRSWGANKNRAATVAAALKIVLNNDEAVSRSRETVADAISRLEHAAVYLQSLTTTSPEEAP